VKPDVSNDDDYGAALRRHWSFDPAVTYLNHGGYGATPDAVLAAQRAWRDRIERNPTGFLSREIDAALRHAASAVGAAGGARGADLVFVENATIGINAVLRSLTLAPGDEVVIPSLAYPAILNAARFAAERAGARLIVVPLPLPIHDAAQMCGAVAARLGARTRLLVIDHITSASAFVSPVAALVKEARAAGARVLVDGAHAPGQLALDIPALGADWYVGNLHKWYFAPRSCGILWAAPEAQRDLHPAAISHGLGAGFLAEFDWTGTHDFSAALTAPDGIAFHRSLGGALLMARNTALARWAAAHLAERWRTETAAPSEMAASMATVRLPARGDASPERARRIAVWLGEIHRIEVHTSADSGALWLRVAAQAYNEPAEYERLGEIVAAAALP
jgi:isopenicillin-N epimerase